MGTRNPREPQFSGQSASPTPPVPSRIIAQCLQRHERQLERLAEICLEAKDPATPFILATGRKVVDDLRIELLRDDIRKQG